MRATFELKTYADTLEEARSEAYQLAAKFLDVSVEAVPALVDLELKVKTYELKADQPEPDGMFEIVVYGNLKHSIAKPL